MCFLQDENIISFLSNFRRTENAAGVEVSVIFNFLGMNNQENMDIVFRGKLPEHGRDSVLEIELLISNCLIWKHELHVINAHDTDIFCVYWSFKSFENLLDRSWTIEIH